MAPITRPRQPQSSSQFPEVASLPPPLGVQVVEQHGIRVLIIHGSNDVLVPAANSRRLAALLPGARLVEFGCCGHMPQEEEAGRFVEEVVAFLNGKEGQGV